MNTKMCEPVLSVVLHILLASVCSLSLFGQDGSSSPEELRCIANAPYQGPERQQVPADVWERDFSRSIEGQLPEAYVTALEKLTDDFTKRAPAVSVAVAIPDKGRWSTQKKAVGSSKAELLPPDAMFQVASTTKTFTALAIMQLQAEGSLSVTQSIQPWFKDAPTAALMTIDHLLRHTSGLVSFNALPAWTLEYRRPQEAIALALAEPLQFCPGTNYAYTNTGYVMLGTIIEQLDQRSLKNSFHERFVRPLHLEHTMLRELNDDLPVVPGHVNGSRIDVPDNYATPHASGGLASTAEDLVTFWHAFLGGRLVPQETVRSMFTDMVRMDNTGQMFYGRGVQLYDITNGPGIMLGHSGGITGFTCVVAYLPADDVYVSVIFNDQNVPAEAGLWAVVRRLRELQDKEKE